MDAKSITLHVKQTTPLFEVLHDILHLGCSSQKINPLKTRFITTKELEL
jgi:hypothetical protein